MIDARQQQRGSFHSCARARLAGVVRAIVVGSAVAVLLSAAAGRGMAQNVVFSISQTDNLDPINAGKYLRYTISYSNVGTDPATNVTITDTYDPALIFNTASPAPDIGTNNVWTVASLSPGLIFQITVTLKVPVSVPPSTVLLSQVTIANALASAQASQTTTVIDALPTRTPTLIPTVTLTRTKTSTRTLTPTPTLTPTRTPQGAATVTATRTDTRQPTATRTQVGGTAPPTPTPTPTRSPTPSVTPASGAALTIDAAAAPNPVIPNGVLVYTLSYSNAGDTAAHNVVITTVYDANLSFIDAAPPPEVGTQNQWIIGTLQPFGGGTITVRAQVRAEAVPPTTLTTTAIATSDESSAAAVETAAVSDTQRCLFLRASNVALFGGARRPGTMVKARLRFADPCTGAGTAVITNPLPPELTFISASPQGTFADGMVMWSVPAKARTLWFNALINPDVVPGTVIRNSAWGIDALGNQTQASDLIRTAAVSQTTSPLGSLVLLARAPRSVTPGGTMKLSFRYRNLLSPGRVTVLLPPEETLLSVGPIPSLIESNGAVTWEGSALRLPRGAMTLKVRVAAGLPAGSVLTHSAAITDSIGSSESATADTLIK